MGMTIEMREEGMVAVGLRIEFQASSNILSLDKWGNAIQLRPLDVRQTPKLHKPSWSTVAVAAPCQTVRAGVKPSC